MAPSRLLLGGLPLLVACAVLMAGCTRPAWYAGLQANELQVCERMQDRDERERCRARLRQSHEAYTRERGSIRGGW